MAVRVIKKSLAGSEDLLLGFGTELQVRNDKNIEITRINASNIPYDDSNSIADTITKKVDTLADMRAMNELPETVWCSGYHSKNDGAFGSHFYRLKGMKTTETDNSGTIIIVSVGGSDYVYELQYSGAVNVKWFGAVGYSTANGTSNTVDSTSSIQAAIDSYSGIDGGEVYFPRGKYRIDGTLMVTKAGTRLVGESNRTSQLICRTGTLALDVEILYGAYTNTAQEYCKFGIDNLGIGASYYASGTTYDSGGADPLKILANTATGIRLRNVFSDSFNNLLTFGFNKHIEFDGVHLCTFNSLVQVNMVQDHPSLPNFKTTIHNRGVGIIGSSVLNPAGEKGGVTNSFIGGWFENTSIDTTNMGGTIFQGIDFEPQSNTNIIGRGNIFRNNRFERFDIFSQADRGSHYDKFPWFQIDGDNCVFEDNILNWTGATIYSPYNLYVVNGDNNYIKLQNQFNTSGLVKFGPEAKGNTIDFHTQFNDYINTSKNANYKYESCHIEQNNYVNTINYIDDENGRKIINTGSVVSGHGTFTRKINFTSTLNSSNWLPQGVTRSLLDVSELPDRRQNLEAFTKLTVNDVSSNVRFQLGSGSSIAITKAGVYTSTALIYIPSSTVGRVRFGTYYGAHSTVYPRDRWVFVVARGYFEVGEYAYPGIRFLDAVVGDIAYIGEISLTEGHLGCYNDTNKSSIHNPESPTKSKYPAIVSRTGAGLLNTFPRGVLFSLYIKDLDNPANYYVGTGYRKPDGTPVITRTGSTIIDTTTTNAGGTVTIIGATNYIATVQEL